MPFGFGSSLLSASARRSSRKSQALKLALDRSLELALEAEKHSHFDIANRLFTKAQGFEADLQSLKDQL